MTTTMPHAPDNSITRVLITAGPTHEPLDSVRFIGNRSSGRMGIALADAAIKQGCEVTLLIGPHTVPIPDSLCALPESQLRIERFRSTDDLQLLLTDLWPNEADILIMAAAVSDFRLPKNHKVTQNTDGKIKRSAEGLTLHLEKTPDLVAGCAAGKEVGQMVIAFALEPAQSLYDAAYAKLKRKNVNGIVANPLETMDSSTVSGTLIWANGDSESPGDRDEIALHKSDFTNWLIERILDRSKQTQ